jgi:hypothetical protein
MSKTIYMLKLLMAAYSSISVIHNNHYNLVLQVCYAARQTLQWLFSRLAPQREAAVTNATVAARLQQRQQHFACCQWLDIAAGKNKESKFICRYKYTVA